MSVALSASQLAAVQEPWDSAGHATLVVATAGSGKTLTLAHRALSVARDLYKQERFQESVLCLCFGKDAASELHERIDGLILEEGLGVQIACPPSDGIYPGVEAANIVIVVKTINSLCNHIVRKVAAVSERKTYCSLVASSGYPKQFMKVPTSVEVNEAIIAGAKVGGVFIPPEGVTKEQRAIRRKRLRELKRLFNRQRVVEADTAAAFPDGFRGDVNVVRGPKLDACRGYVQHMRSQNYIDFHDQIIQAACLILGSERVRTTMRGRYAHLVVDEFQDVGATELAVIHGIGRSFSFVGDDDQAIYGFKSGVPVEWQALHQVRNKWKSVKIMELAENRRCPPSAVRFAYSSIRSNGDRISKVIRPLKQTGLPVVVASKTIIPFFSTVLDSLACDGKHLSRSCALFFSRSS